MPYIKPNSIPPKSLTKSITSASLAIRLNNITSWKKNSLGAFINLAASDFGTRAYGALRNSTGTILEIVEFNPSTIASTDVTLLKRGLSFDGGFDTEVTAYKLDWPAGTIFQAGTDLPQLLNSYSQITDGILAPTSTPVKVGDIFVNTVLGKAYISTGTSSSADWKILN